MAEGIIREEDIAKVREASDLVAVVAEVSPVRQKGRDFWCCCPIHQEKTPSFKIDPDLQLWHCFGCGEGGDVFGFIMKTRDLSFPEAVRFLADRASIQLTETTDRRSPNANRKSRLKEICSATADFYHRQLMRSKSSDAAAARSYLANRGFGGGVPKLWNLGFAPGHQSLVHYLKSLGYKADEMVEANVAMKSRDGRLRDRFFNRVMFPINDVTGECIAFGGRVIGSGEPKYLNSQETPLFHKSRVLYGLDKAKASMASTGIAVVVEGYTDVIALSTAGITNVVATLGTALTLSHIRSLSRHAQKRIVYLFDGDEAGQRAADRALAFIDESMTPEAGRHRLDLCAVTLPDDLDPAEFVNARGAEALQALIDQAQPLLQYGIQRRLSRHDLSTAEGRSRALSDALAILAPIKDSLLAKDYAMQIAGMVRAREQDVLDALAALKPASRRFDETWQETPASQSQANNGRYEQGVSQNSQPSHGGEQGRRTMSSRPSVSSSTATKDPLIEAERNRRRIEREYLSLLVQQPLLALAQGDKLQTIQWHGGIHRQIAEKLLEILTDQPDAKADEIVSALATISPDVAGMLTASTLAGEAAQAQWVDYLAEELALGDTEAELEKLRGELARLQVASDFDGGQSYQELFAQVVSRQQQLNQRRLNHRPPV